MKINGPLPSISNIPGIASPRAVASADKSAGATSVVDRVDISPLSAHLQEAWAGEAPIDVQKIAEIKQAIAEGRFQIHPERIASGLLESVREMLTARR